MSMKNIRDRYTVPAKRGMRVMANGEMGRILGTGGAYLRIKLDMYKKPALFHPTWHMTYFAKNTTEVFMGGGRL